MTLVSGYMRNADREVIYARGGRKITPRQGRRMRHKANRSKKRGRTP